MKIGPGVLPSPIDKAHGLYNSLYYRTSRDKDNLFYALDILSG